MKTIVQDRQQSAESGRKVDVLVTSNRHGVFTFHPVTLRALAWLAANVPKEYYVDGHVEAGPLNAARLAVRMGIEDIVIA